MCEITDKEVKQMIKYDFKETYELNETEKKTVEKINTYCMLLFIRSNAP